MLTRTGCLAAGLALAACSGEGYRSLHEVPERPVVEPREQRLAMGDALLADRAAAERAGATLRHETGRGPAPGPIEAVPGMPRPAPESTSRRPENVEARYVEERVRAETSDTSLGDFMRRVARLPEDSAVPPPAGDPAGPPAPEEVAQVPARPAAGGPGGDGRAAPPPLLDKALAVLGLGPRAVSVTAGE